MATKKAKLTPKQIEDIYDSGQYRLTQERSDFLLPQIIDFVRQKKWINLRPEYQRRLVWDRRKKSLFIESLLMNIPVPPVFLYETDLSRYEVMDGQQRLNAIVEFYENQLKLTGLETWSALNGYTYQQCPPRIRSGLDRRRISANVLLAESASSASEVNFIRRTVFERLNTGGQQLNAQELRNSLYSGPFNEMLIELAGNRLFDQIWEIPPYDEHYKKDDGFINTDLAENKLFKRMTDCEIVLRFFAFRRPSAIKGSVRSMLDDCMASHREASSSEIDAMKSSFISSLDLAHHIFGTRTFQAKDIQSGKWRLSQPLFDAVMVASERHLESKSRLVSNRTKIVKNLEAALSDPETYEIVVGRPNTAAAIKERLSIVDDIFTNHC
ncbi:DUF262 domain-containing protein [Prosthecobacter vanneervenii]|uniref:GmrSD restriction endonucleases N-terminal domain-containing protein n=1 Tax=Prosthecobacter vanneervenii TaxID=48466 RepID=A0A7W8DKN9_9BACT|nr:DUF262 domain-containing protein [Prosthecobacter vanneervenii]MBB5033408.1 hypothetical protein [Prosthecobacter vanneervenii]